MAGNPAGFRINPNGVAASSPGLLAAGGLPLGQASPKNDYNPNGVAPERDDGATQSGLNNKSSWDRKPRVAAKRRDPGLEDVAPLGQSRTLWPVSRPSHFARLKVSRSDRG
jgi:hypothetical protein